MPYETHTGRALASSFFAAKPMLSQCHLQSSGLLWVVTVWHVHSLRPVSPLVSYLGFQVGTCSCRYHPPLSLPCPVAQRRPLCIWAAAHRCLGAQRQLPLETRVGGHQQQVHGVLVLVVVVPSIRRRHIIRQHNPRLFHKPSHGNLNPPTWAAQRLQSSTQQGIFGKGGKNSESVPVVRT